jgi:hypothetical protein
VGVSVVQSLGEEKAEELAVVVLHDGAEAGGKGGELQPTHILYTKKNQFKHLECCVIL